MDIQERLRAQKATVRDVEQNGLAIILSLYPLLAPSHLLAHRSCELNSGPNPSKKNAKLQVDLIEY
jgi:hypothetical protein